MIIKELQLSVTKTWGDRTLPVNSKEWRSLRQKVLERDKHTCRFCGFRANKYMIVDHMDGDASNNNMTNFGINCQACDKIRHCGLAGINNYLVTVAGALSQVDIIKNSRKFVKRCGRPPKPLELGMIQAGTSRSIVILANKMLEEKKIDSNIKGMLTSEFPVNMWQLEWEL